jgi:hypothetical protein
MHEHGFMTPENIYVHAATLTEDSYNRIAASGGSVSVSTESEQSAGQGYPPTWQLRKHDIPVSLSMDTSVWWSGDLFCAMRSTLGADRSREHLEAHAKQETVTNHHLRAEQVVDWATRGGARAPVPSALFVRHCREHQIASRTRRRARALKTPSVNSTRLRLDSTRRSRVRRSREPTRGRHRILTTHSARSPLRRMSVSTCSTSAEGSTGLATCASKPAASAASASRVAA